MSTPDIRWQQRFDNYRKALVRLNEVVTLSQTRALSEIEEEGLIQRFEYTHELAWKVLKDFLEYQDGVTSITGSKDTVRMAFQRGLITQGEVWMSMIESRNLSSHTYNPEAATEVASQVTTSYIGLFNALEKELGARYAG